MNGTPEIMSELPMEELRTSTPPIRPMYWSIRRELWENRSLYIAPLVVAAFQLFGFVISTIGMPARRKAVLLLEPAKQRASIGVPYDIAAGMLIAAGFIVSVFYCLDALQAERRDRSILFWKSLPVSDRVTVLSKAFVVLAIMPLIIFTLIVVTHFLMLLWSSVVLLPSGLSLTTWSRFNLLKESLIVLYGLIALTLWHAPIYGWLVLISAWSRKAPFLWAFLPIPAIAALERMTSNTTLFLAFVQYRILGGLSEAFAKAWMKKPGLVTLEHLTPGRFLSSAGLWSGLIFAAVCFAASIRLRRRREPI